MGKITRLVTVLALASLASLSAMLLGSLPKLDGKAVVRGLGEKVEIASDGLGIPTLRASSRGDVFRALGWIHARDRLFQMELMRRKSAGRLAELFGSKALDLDRRQRSYGFERAAEAILASLPDDQKQVLADFAGGVNAYLAQAKLLPPEFLLLRHHPESWRPEDSLLVGLGMFQTLNAVEDEERMLSVMERALPSSLVQFLTPDSDQYDAVLLGGGQSLRPARPIPVSDFAALGKAVVAEGSIDSTGIIAGSNHWAVNGTKTRDGRAILADDMHLTLSVPNIWFRATLKYEGRELTGVTLPGLPLIIVGSNGHVAWGFTNTEADVLDLVKLEINPSNPEEYRTPRGWRAFERRRETFRVKGGDDAIEEAKDTIWGPVSPRPLLGAPVAIHWTALLADGVDIGLLHMDRVDTLEEALDVMNLFGGPTQNAAIADDKGRIGWTLLGRYPLRFGYDGSASRSWSDGAIGWNGYIPPRDLPRLIDPPKGYIATANNRTLGAGYPYVIGHNQANGYRAYRISQRLAELKNADEMDLFEIQLDTRSEFFEFYRTLALEILGRKLPPDAELEEARRYISAWDGKMEADSQGIGLLWRFRERLASATFAPVVARCRQLEPDFNYSWRMMESPLRALLTERIPSTLPDASQGDWEDLILHELAESVKDLKRLTGQAALDGLGWGKVNRVSIRHPLTRSIPVLSALLDMEESEFSGCSGFCVRIVGNGHGASERMVISPGHPEQGILHMPAGQSGHPFSPNYRDQQPAWRDGAALQFLPGKTERTLILTPD